MKKLVTLILVLSLATVSSAALKLSVNGTVDAEGVVLLPSQTVVIDIWGDGGTQMGDFYLGIGVVGDGSLNIAGITFNYAGQFKGIQTIDDPDSAGSLGVKNPFYMITLNDPVIPPATPAPLIGTLVNGIIFHCDGPATVTLMLFDGGANPLDTQVITQPEPMTLLLLGLGGLFLRRK